MTHSGILHPAHVSNPEVFKVLHAARAQQWRAVLGNFTPTYTSEVYQDFSQNLRRRQQLSLDETSFRLLFSALDHIECDLDSEERRSAFGLVLDEVVPLVSAGFQKKPVVTVATTKYAIRCIRKLLEAGTFHETGIVNRTSPQKVTHM